MIKTSIGIVVLSFACLLVFFTREDPYYLIPIHFALGGALLFYAATTGGLREAFRTTTAKGLRRGVGTTIYSGLFVGALVLVNYASAGRSLLHIDTTAEDVYSLAPQTKGLIKQLPDELKLRVFVVAGEIERPVEKLLRRASRISNKFNYEVVDPEKEPTVAASLGIRKNESYYFSLGKKELLVTGGFDEEKLANSILKLSQKEKKIVYYLTGHGEPGLGDDGPTSYSSLKESIENENFVLKELIIGADGEIPSDASALVISAPRGKLLEQERKVISKYLDNGGSALMASEPNTNSEIAELVSKYGINVGRDIVVDEEKRAMAAPTMGVKPMVTTFGKHQITKDFEQGVLFPTVSSVAVTSPNARELAYTSKKSWAETSVELVFSKEPKAWPDAADRRGPIPVAAAYQGKEKNEPARLVVFGDADFISNINIRELFNRDFFLNSLSWVSGSTNNIALRPRSLKETTTGISKSTFDKMFLISVFILPEILAILGLSVWLRRKRY